MNETTPKPAETDPRLTERWQSLVDIMTSPARLAVPVSAGHPVVGLSCGVLLLFVTIAAKGRKTGKVRIILGIVNTAPVILAFTLVRALGLAGAFAGTGKD